MSKVQCKNCERNLNERDTLFGYCRVCADLRMRRYDDLEAENKKLRATMRLHAGDCCSLSNEVDMFRGYWEDEEAENKRLREALLHSKNYSGYALDHHIARALEGKDK